MKGSSITYGKERRDMGKVCAESCHANKQDKDRGILSPSLWMHKAREREYITVYTFFLCAPKLPF